MAKKKTPAPSTTTTRFSLSGSNMQHFKTTEAYAQLVDALFDRAIKEITALAAKGKYDPSKPFRFDDYPALKKQMEATVQSLTKKITATIEQGQKQEWLYANKKNDTYISAIMNTSKLSKAQLEQLQDQNLDALTAFQRRKSGGLGLSDHVWKIGKQFREQIEDALDVGLGDGRSAQELARDVKQMLNEPDRLFRRVRDKNGNLRLSKAAQAYHPGRGVYRSSVRNAQRLTRTEINMAYRQSDWQRWQSLDFVVGFEICRSNHKPLCKCTLCEQLKGRYPKNFKFVGWHPQCMCYAIPILEDDETFDENEKNDLKAALNGTTNTHIQSKNTVTTVPKGFNDWVAQNADRQANWESTPYFIRDNFKNGSLEDGLKDEVFDISVITFGVESEVETKVEAIIRSWGELTKDEQQKYKDMRNSSLYELPYELKSACDLYGVKYDAYEDMYWDLYDETKPNVDWDNNYLDYPDYYKWDKAIAERERIENELAGKIADAKAKALQKQSAYVAFVKAGEIWFGDVCDRNVEHLEDEFKDQATEQYPNYISILNAKSLEPDYSMIDIAKKQYNDAIDEAKKFIAAYPKVDVSKLQSLMAETMTKARPAVAITKDLLATLKQLKPVTIKDKYDTKEQVNETFNEINERFATGSKLLEHGEMKLEIEIHSGCNGSTNMDGKIWLTKPRLERVMSALGKIGSGKAADITKDEADAMATFWHEITHNRNVPGNSWSNIDRTKLQTSYMELANEWVARHSLSEFYAILGVKDMPFPEFQNNRDSTGYNSMVTNYDYVIDTVGLDRAKVYESVRKHLFTAPYNNQVEGLKNGLVAGGLHLLETDKKGNYKPVSKSTLSKLVRMIESARDGYTYDKDWNRIPYTKEELILKFLKENGIIVDDTKTKK